MKKETLMIDNCETVRLRIISSTHYHLTVHK